MNKPCYDNSAESADLLIIIAAALQRIVTFTCCDSDTELHAQQTGLLSIACHDVVTVSQ